MVFFLFSILYMNLNLKKRDSKVKIFQEAYFLLRQCQVVEMFLKRLLLVHYSLSLYRSITLLVIPVTAAALG